MAIFDEDDQRHTSATRSWKSILNSDVEILTSNYVVVETTALLHSRFGTSAVRVFVEDIVPAMTVFWVDQSVHDLANAAVLATSGKSGPSLVDCVSFEVIRRSKIDRVFAYDKHFRAMGYDLIG
jgi:predicted nucleic acid-binding protein